MRVMVITPPGPIVTWEEADAHLRLGGDTTEQPYVEQLIAGVSALLDGPNGTMASAIGVQTLEVQCGRLDDCSFRLPCPPAIEILSVSTLDAGNVERQSAPEDFYLAGDRNNILTPQGDGWPWSNLARRHDAIRIQYRAGYAVVPSPIKLAVLICVAELFTNRDMGAAGLSGAAADLLDPYRAYL